MDIPKNLHLMTGTTEQYAWRLSIVSAASHQICCVTAAQRCRCTQGLGIEHLRLLAALPRLTVLNLRHMTWAEDAVGAGPTLLATTLPHLRVLNVPGRALVRITLHATVLIAVTALPLSLPASNV